MILKQSQATSLKEPVKRLLGSPDYMAPELIEDKVNPKELKKTDFWSLGCILYEFLVGITPFGSSSAQGVFENILNKQIIWPKIGYGEDELHPEA
jgi:serine/threonine-protein kinase RIM15